MKTIKWSLVYLASAISTLNAQVVGTATQAPAPTPVQVVGHKGGNAHDSIGDTGELVSSIGSP